MTDRTYIAIDLKSFYASVECMDRQLDPMTTNLVVIQMRTILKIMCYFTIKEISGVSTLFTLLKWVFFEGQQREFFPARRAKIVENVKEGYAE